MSWSRLFVTRRVASMGRHASLHAQEHKSEAEARRWNGFPSRPPLSPYRWQISDGAFVCGCPRVCDAGFHESTGTFCETEMFLVSLAGTESLCRHYQLGRPPLNTMRSSLCTRKQGSETPRKRDDGRQCIMLGFF